MRPHREGSGAVSADLTDFEWAAVSPLLSGIKTRGIKRLDDRGIIDGILWRLRTGRSWAAIPARYGSGRRCHARFIMWRNSGVWARIVAAVAAAYGGEVTLIDATATFVPLLRRGAAPDPVAWTSRVERSEAA